MGFADAHLHPAERIGDDAYPDLGDAELLFGCSSRTSEWEAMRGLEDGRIVHFYGVHPWYAGEWSAEAEGRLREILESDPRAGVGEVGLDSKRGSQNQTEAFEAQLAVAEEMGRAVNVHCVGSERDVVEALSRHRRIPHVIIHSFSNESYAVPFLRLGCHLSVNPRVMARSGARLSRLMDSISDDRLLLESDAPFTPRFAGMGDFVTGLASAVGSDPDSLVGTALDNARSIS